MGEPIGPDEFDADLTEVDIDGEGELEEPDEFLATFRDGYLEGYGDGIIDGRMQGKEAAMFLVKQAFKDYYDTDIQDIVERLEASW
jgi:hypothetical protein